MESKAIKYIGKEVKAIVDRPIGSSHPNYPDHIYLVNYGYIPNTISGDGEELDCYILGEYKPLKEYEGKCIAVIHRLNEDDDKWDVAPLLYPFGNGINFQLEVENVEKIYNSLKEHKYKIAFEIEKNWYRQDDNLLGNKEFLVQDPDGYLLRFSEDLGEK